MVASDQYKLIRHLIRLDSGARVPHELLTQQDTEGYTNKDYQIKSKYPTQAANLLSILDGFVSKIHCSSESGADDSGVEMLTQRLLSYAINWNTRTRTSMISQCVLNWILTRWTPEELLEWPNFSRTIQSLLPYTNRHYQRICRLEEQLAILDYISELTDEHLVPTTTTAFNTTMDYDGLKSVVEPMELDGDQTDLPVDE
ncbi:unnamed protein product [Trichobilharzia regenti]|nr:unnamed protein product [Trichobilharzia regenti]